VIQRPFQHYIYIALVLLAATLFTAPLTRAEGTVPPIIPNTYVQDHSHVLTSDQKAQLETRLASLKQSYDIEIGLATVPDFSGFADEQQLATAMAREYKIGSATSKYGLLILFKTNEKVRYFLAPSTHTQGRLTDGQLGTIGRQAIVPHLQRDSNGNRDWAGAFNASLASLEPLLIQLKGELNTQAAGATAPVANSGIGGWTIFFIIVGIFLFLYFLYRIGLLGVFFEALAESGSSGSSWSSSSSSSSGDSISFSGGGSFDGGGAGGGVD